MKKYQFLTSGALKLIALCSMLIDHFAAAVLHNGTLLANASAGDYIVTIYNVMRAVGRLAFPLYCFLLIEGFLHTSNRKNYFLNLLIFAVISEIPFDLCISGTFFAWTHQNVLFTFALALVMLCFLERFSNNFFLQLLFAAAAAFISYFLKFDYGWIGILLIAVLYYFRQNRYLQCGAGAVAFCWHTPASLPAFALMLFYNGKRKKSWKYLFYIIYPAHLLLFFIIAKCFL